MFIVSIRRDVNDDCFGFPKGFPLNRRLKDVLESNVDEKYYLSDDAVNVMVQHRLRNEAKGNGFGAKFMDGNEVCSTLVTGSYKSNSPYLKVKQIGDGINCIQLGQLYGTEKEPNPQAGRVYDADGLSPTMDTCQGGNRMPKVVVRESFIIDGSCGNIEPNVLSPKRTDYGKRIRSKYESGEVRESRHNMTNLVPRTDNIANTLTSVQKDNYLCEPIALDEQNGYLRKDGCVGTLTTDGSSPKHNNRVVQLDFRIRKLTPKECFRLMGFDDRDVDVLVSNGISDSQLYKMAGNSIVVDVLVALLRNVLRCDGCDVFEPSGSLF